MFAANVPETMIKEVTGHKSSKALEKMIKEVTGHKSSKALEL